MTVRVVFTPSGLQGSVDEGTTALEAARALGADLDSVCGGRGICGRCQVVPTTGEFPKWAITATAESLSPPGTVEAAYSNRGGRRPLDADRRLGCAVQLFSDMVLDIPPDSQIHKQVVRKEVDVGDLIVEPRIVLRYLEPAERHPEDGTSLDTRLIEQLAIDWPDDQADRGQPVIEPDLLADLAGVLADGPVTIAVRRNDTSPDRIVGAWSGFVDRVVGAAIDIGSTTVAGHLCDLTTGEVLASAGTMNPQIRFGEDLMSRVSYVMMNDGGDAELTEAIGGALDELVTNLLDQADAMSVDRLLDIVLVGNPIMHHIALGIDPTPLGQSPFPLATDRAVATTATAVGIDAARASVYFAPCIAGHVGADTAAAILSEGPHRNDTTQLLIDVGTNAEIVVGNADGLLAASSPTGPAFEGAQITNGQRATAGAIERVRIDTETLEPRFRVIGCDLWSDDPDFEVATAGIGVTGICGSGIIEVVAELFLARVVDTEGVIRGEMANRSARIEANDRTFAYRLTDRVVVTQADVRAIQLAKGALRAGIDLLMDHAGLDSVDEIRLAGAFGAHISPLHAMILGLIPDCPLDRVRAVGNAAGSGAVRALLSTSQRAEMEAAVQRVTKIETATEKRFPGAFVKALAFPHLDAPTPNLEAAVELPPRQATNGAGGAGDGAANGDGTRRRRRRGRRPARATGGTGAETPNETGATDG